MRTKQKRTLNGTSAGTLPTGFYQVVPDPVAGFGVYYYIQNGSPFKLYMFDGNQVASLAGGYDKIIQVPAEVLTDYTPLLQKGVYYDGTSKKIVAFENGTAVTLNYLDGAKTNTMLKNFFSSSMVDNQKTLAYWDEKSRFVNSSLNMMYGTNNYNDAPKYDTDPFTGGFSQIEQNGVLRKAEKLKELQPTVQTNTATTTATQTPVTAPKSNKMLWIVGGLALAGTGIYFFTKTNKRK